MSTDNPKLAILGGTGKEGTGLALRWAAAGYHLVIGSRQVEKASAAAEKINRQLGTDRVSGKTNVDAARQADVCILTVTFPAHQAALESVKEVMAGKILVDATSRVDFLDPKPPSPPSAGEAAQAMLGPGVRVVAAFQNVPARQLLKNLNQALDADVLVCADDDAAADQVVRLAAAAGLRGYFAGPLANANVVEGITSILISLNKHYGVKDASIKVYGVPI